ncbi:MAG: hypothetical protein BGO40_12520 [Chryseobacterium sp. 39-10]|nr:glycosyltransferase family 39 protein [Chryseobacterium sp.]OJV48635.1 MAG: hypothetical protein BGO40_12520 [Chryseobacterium sp. 39-10]
MKELIFRKENFILLFFLAIYIFSVGSDPILGDSLPFTVGASKGYELESNATNHFLYINFLALVHKIIPFINPHYLFSGISVICSVLSLLILRNILLLFNFSNIVCNVVTVLFGFSFTFWRISIFTEVYSFYILFVTIFLYNVFSYIKEQRIDNLYGAAIFFGIMFLIHIQTILLIPFYLYFLYKNLHEKSKTAIAVLIPIVFFSVLLIPVVLGRNNFIAIFTDNAWGSSFFSLELESILRSAVRNTGFLLYNFMFFIAFAFKGFKDLENKEYFFIGIIPYIFFILKHDVSDSYVFQLVPYLFLLIMIASGLSKLNDFKWMYIAVFSFPLVYFINYKIVECTDVGKRIDRETGFKGGTKYFFFPPLKGNPSIEEFISAYEKGQFKKLPVLEQENYKRMYLYAKEWRLIKT